MFLKLARFEDPEVGGYLLECCKQNNVEFIPIIHEYFGLLTTNFAMSYGRDDFACTPQTNLASFVKTYECAASNGVVYVGLLLTNAFFQNVSIFCREFDILIAGVEIISQYGSNETITKEIQETLDDDTCTIKTLFLEIKGISVIINSLGYIDIGDRNNFFSLNKSIIINMIKIGINDD